MKKILFAVHTLQVGGAEKVLINLLKNIDKNKYDITVLSIVNDGLYIQDINNLEGIKYKYIFNSFFKNIRQNKQAKFNKICTKLMDIIWKIYILIIKYIPKLLYKISVKEEYDIEIAFLEGKVSKFLANSKNRKSKKIAWIHTDINNVSKINIFKNIKDEIETYKKFDKIICVSKDVKNKFIQKTGIKENLYVQINPINSKEILKKSNEIIHEELNQNGYIICSVGRLVKEKGFDRLLEVHNRLIQDNIVHTLWIIGEGKERKELEKYIKNNHLEQTVNLVGYSNNPYKYLKKADIFVCSSRIEGLSSALLEATILEKVIVSTNCPGTKEILGENSENAMIVDNNIDGLYEGLKTVLTNPNIRNKFKKNIQQRSKLFNIDNVIKDIEKLINE